jgi:hypothetical protein
MSHAEQSPSATSVVAPNGTGYTDSNASNSASTIDSNDKELEATRHAVDQLSLGHPEWLNRSRALASLLSKRFQETSRNTLLAESIDIQRQICAVCTAGNPDELMSIVDLASSLRTYFMQIGEESLLIEAIDLTRDALSH